MQHRNQSGFVSTGLVVGVFLFTLAYAIQSVRYATSRRVASATADDTFAAALPYNKHLQDKYWSYTSAAYKARNRGLPAPDWKPSDCELQTFDLRDYERAKAVAAVKPYWPASWLATRTDVPQLPVITPGCEMERARTRTEPRADAAP